MQKKDLIGEIKQLCIIELLCCEEPRSEYDEELIDPEYVASKIW